MTKIIKGAEGLAGEPVLAGAVVQAVKIDAGKARNVVETLTA